MTKLEEIARAIGDARCDAGRPDPGKGLDEFIARDVLSTLKTPTPGMIEAGRQAWLESALDYTRLEESISAAYRAMIDAIK